MLTTRARCCYVGDWRAHDSTLDRRPIAGALVRLCGFTLVSAVLDGSIHGSEARAFPVSGACGAAGAECSARPRVRSSHAYLRAMIDQAVTRSSTFRRIVAAIEATDGIVYVEHGDCKHGVRACLVLDVTAAAGYRILRIIVDARQPDWDVMASIGHELRHALEVLEDPGLVDTPGVYLFYATGAAGEGPAIRNPRGRRRRIRRTKRSERLRQGQGELDRLARVNKRPDSLFICREAHVASSGLETSKRALGRGP